MSIMVEAVCFITGFDNASQSMNCHIHQTQLCIIFHFFLSIESHGAIRIHTGLIYKITGLNEHATRTASRVSKVSVFDTIER